MRPGTPMQYVCCMGEGSCGSLMGRVDQLQLIFTVAAREGTVRFSDNSEEIASSDIGKMEVKNFESVPDGALNQFHWRREQLQVWAWSSLLIARRCTRASWSQGASTRPGRSSWRPTHQEGGQPGYHHHHQAPHRGGVPVLRWRDVLWLCGCRGHGALFSHYSGGQDTEASADGQAGQARHWRFLP